MSHATATLLHQIKSAVVTVYFVDLILVVDHLSDDAQTILKILGCIDGTLVCVCVSSNCLKLDGVVSVVKYITKYRYINMFIFKKKSYTYDSIQSLNIIFSVYILSVSFEIYQFCFRSKDERPSINVESSTFTYFSRCLSQILYVDWTSLYEEQTTF